MRINYNISAMLASNELNRNNDTLATSIQKLSSGFKINSAADDAAGLAIAKKMNAQIEGLKQANRNSEDGISIVNTADGAMGEIENILQRMNELSVQAANGTNSTSDRSYIQEEINQMVEEIDRIANTSQFNSQNLLDGTFALKGYTSSENVKVFSYSDYVNTGTYTIDSISYTYYVNTTVDTNNNRTSEETYEINELDAIKANLGDRFPEGANVTSEDDILTISGDNKFEIKLSVNNRNPVEKNALGEDLTSTTTSISYYITSSYQNVVVVDEETNSRFNLSLLDYVRESDQTWSTSLPAYVNDESFHELSAELVESGAIDASRYVTGISYEADFEDPRVKITLDNGDVKDFRLEYSLEEKLAAYANYKEKDVSKYDYDSTNNIYNVYLNGSDTVSYTVPKEALIDPLDTYLKKTTYTEKSDYTIGTQGDETDSISLDITNKGGMRLQVGSNEGQVIEVILPSMNTVYMGIDKLDLTTDEKATEAIDKISKALTYVSAVRAKVGAYENRLQHTVTNLDTTEENMTGAYSRIMDVDMADEMTTYSTFQVLVQSSTSMLAQANELPQSVLQLLQ